MNARVLVPVGPSPSAARTREIVFREKDSKITETAVTRDGKSKITFGVDGATETEADFHARIQSGKYRGPIHEEISDGSRTLVLSDPRAVVLTTDAARVA